MATESAADTELSVSLPPSLSEWLDERAAALGVARETLLVQLLGTYRKAADIDDDELGALLSDAVDDDRGSVEDLRSRILQLKDAVHSRTPAEHPQIETLAERVESLSADVESTESDIDDIASELEAFTAEFGSTDDRLGTIETKLHRLNPPSFGDRR